MPLYEYHCDDCRCEFEVLRSFSQADEPVSCIQCDSPQTRRAISLFAAVSKSDAGGGDGRSLGGTGCASCAATSCATCKT
ncbi:MAG: FmdB family transcriptional regulator [Chloroflexi bacterium B3_Chlor]|nr:MAG: FmdB family transcriptional regulator [Chloroflexi bacterium B3_Chlor]